MAQPRVLITGINGYIAAHTAAVFLKAGYAVRGTVRARTPNVDSLVRTLARYHDGSSLELVEVPDISTDGAFDRAVEGVQAIAHLASPVSMAETDPAPMMRAAVHGTTSLLASALAESQRARGAPSPLRTVVFMSTISAVFSPAKPPGHVFTEADWNDAAEDEVRRLGRDAPGYVIYQASKTAAEKAFWRVGREAAPVFGMTALCPAPVLGPPLYLPEPIASLSMRVKDVHDIFHGGPIPEFSPIRSTFVDVRDVAELVLRAVEDEQAQGSRERYLLVGQSQVSPQEMADVLREGFPERRGIIQEGKPGETYPGMTWGFDAGKAGGLLGREWTGFRQSVLDSAKVFLEAESA